MMRQNVGSFWGILIIGEGYMFEYICSNIYIITGNGYRWCAREYGVFVGDIYHMGMCDFTYVFLKPKTQGPLGNLVLVMEINVRCFDGNCGVLRAYICKCTYRYMCRKGILRMGCMCGLKGVVYLNIHTPTHLYKYTYVRTHLYVYTYMYIYVHIHNIHICTYICIYISIYVYVCACTYV